jgi:hypothetical protein
MKKNVLLIVALIAAIGGSFWGGMEYGQSKGLAKIPEEFGNFQNRMTTSTGGQIGMRSGGATMGEIISKNDDTITVKLRDGGSKIIFYSDSTKISKTADGTSADLETGKTVSVNGKTNDDGSLTAQSIQIIPGTPNQP